MGLIFKALLGAGRERLRVHRQLDEGSQGEFNFREQDERTRHTVQIAQDVHCRHDALQPVWLTDDHGIILVYEIEPLHKFVGDSRKPRPIEAVLDQ